ncbi:MAG: hypothetical protein HZA74_13290 [Ignavibacteriales bacterium]|nr:hypothetical protein [Ignavibacteriales bacterium]
MKEQKHITYYKRNLPHYQPEGYTFFVTFRLAGSLPINVIKKLKEDKEKELKKIDGMTSQKQKVLKYYEYQRKYFGRFDGLLDKSESNPMWLQEEGVAEIVKEAIHFRDGKEYELVAYTIMPNHVHLVFRPIVGDINVAIQNVSGDLSRENNNIPTDQIVGDINVAIQKPNYLVTDILRKLKGSTARDCNKLLKRTGAFWHHESYDHVVRNIEELRRIVNYVLLNPVKAGLVDDYEKWKWSYYNPKYLM